MVRRKKKRVLPPRRLRMNRSGRLQSARTWLAKFGGKNIIRSYARWYGVDKLCAIRELQMLGVSLPAERVEAIKASMANRKRKLRRPTGEVPEGWGESWDDDFAVIVDYTEGGAPIGIRWEDYEDREQAGTFGKPISPAVQREKDDDDFDLPF